MFDLGKFKPDKVLETMWANFATATTPEAASVQKRLRIVAAGGDGTVAWILQARLLACLWRALAGCQAEP